MKTKDSRKPHIIFITTDTMGRGMCSACVDRPGVETPNLERLAADGVLFENAFTASPVCTPARSSWYSGLHPNRNGAWTNNVSMKRGLPLLAELLRDAGYRAKHLGKWHLDGGSYNGHGASDGGFDDTWYDISNFLDEVGRDGINRFGAWNKGFEDETFCFGHKVADNAIRLISEAATSNTPLFLAVEFDEPHGPYICPPPFHNRHSYEELYRPPTLNADMAGKPKIQQEYAAFLRAGRSNPEDLPKYYHKYYDCNSYVDYEIGRVIDAVQSHMGDDAVIICTSDHGDHLGAFGLCAKGPTMYDHTCAVPLLINGVGRAGHRIESLASSVDLFPTILDLAAVDTKDLLRPADGYTGRSLLPLLEGDVDAVRQEVLIEFNRFGIAHDQDDGLFPIRCIRTDRWKLVINLFDRDEFYDLANDPEETTNLIDVAAHAAARDDLHDRLLAWQRQTRDPFRSPQWLLREWRQDAKHDFEGLFTTGCKDDWESEEFL